MIILVVAHDSNLGIGINNALPWKIKKDMQRFKQITEGKTVVMGYNTFMSIPEKFRPLPNRVNIVLTKSHKEELKDYDVAVVDNIETIIEMSKAKDFYVIGGDSIYRQFIGHAEVIYSTEITDKFECDTFFPDYHDDFRRISPIIADEENDIIFVFSEYIR